MKRLSYRLALAFVALCVSCVSVFAQQGVRGTVKDAAGEPVLGAAVVVKGTSNGTMADIDGKWALASIPQDAVLEVSSIGYQTQEVAVNGRNVIDVILAEDNEMLNDVVVVGYGVQKKSVVSAAISSISKEDLSAQSNTRIDNVLQGMTSGVTVVRNNGAPDAGSTIRIRGNGTTNNSNPLYIVDGFIVDGGIDYLNPNDIERIEILKDAASGAVYGTKAANGVILVTTKKGKAGKSQIAYDFSYGVQNAWRKPQVLNATEYAIMMNEGALNQGNAPVYDDPYSLGQGTDWVDAVFNKNAPVVKHDISISGGSDKATYSISGGYLSQEGIIGGNFGRSNYERATFREAVNFTVFDETANRNILNKLSLSQSISYANIHATGISTNSEYGSPLGSALGMSPLDTIYADDETFASYRTLYPSAFRADGTDAFVRDAQGRVYTVVDGGVYNEQKNPLADLSLPGTQYNTDKFIINGSAELNIWDNLKFKSSVGIDMAFWGNHGHSTEYFLSSKLYNLTTTNQSKSTCPECGEAIITEKTSYATGASQEMNRAFRWQVDNVLSYDKTFGKHGIAVILGQSAIRSISANVGASAKNLRYTDPWKISVNNTDGQQNDGDRNGWGSWNSIVYSLVSYFGRVSYNYDERYMLEATLRRDGSSRFGDNNKWGFFPSLSMAWNFRNEPFMDSVSALSLGKLRASYGVNGNDNIKDFAYAVMMDANNNYVFGSGGNASESINNGVKPSGLANPSARWEQTSQFDLGLDLGFFGNRLTFTTDYYIKQTSGILMDMMVPSYAGDSAPKGNVGDMRNSGIEFEIGYRNHVGDFNYHASVNATYNKNTLVALGDDASYIGGASHKIGSSLTRGEVGLPFPYFYGYKTDGVFQNWDEINSYTYTNPETGETNLIQPKAQPGDFRWVDATPDGVIDDNDRVMLGKGMPDWTYGMNLGFNFKGFDFNVLVQGQLGVQAWYVTRRTDLYNINLPKIILNRWTGEGSTNSAPRFSYDSANENYRASDYWIYDASFLRVRNMQFGYTLPQKITRYAGIERFRVYLQAENLLTLTKYPGCDPEVGGGSTEMGVDRGVYPQPRTFTVGVNLAF